jgi:hypothetical protein
MWSAEFYFAIVEDSSGVATAGHVIFSVTMYKTGGVAYAGDVQLISADYQHGTYYLIIDTTTNTSQHRISLASGDGIYPYENMRLVCTIKYTQIRIES